MNNDTHNLLKSVPYFAALPNNTLDDVWQHVVIRRYNAGEIIFLEGEPDVGLHLVVQGLAKVYRLSTSGKEHILLMLGPGDSCNEVPVVDGGPNPANFAAIEDTEVWIISSQALTELCRTYPILQETITKNLAMRCRQLVQRVHNLSFLSVTERVIAFLLQQPKIPDHPWTQDEIAAQLGTVREMVSRSLRELQAENLIRVTRQGIEIIDREALETLL